MLRDLHPYVCTFPSCSASNRLFERRHEWFQHELQVHRRLWRCIDGCQAIFTSQSKFETHLREDHTRISTLQLADLVSLCEQQINLDLITECRLCGQKGLSIRGLEKHIGNHQEQLALFALPSVLPEEEEGGGGEEEPNQVVVEALRPEGDLGVSRNSPDDQMDKQRGREFLPNSRSEVGFSTTPISSTTTFSLDAFLQAESYQYRPPIDLWQGDRGGLPKRSPQRSAFATEDYQYPYATSISFDKSSMAPSNQPPLQSHNSGPSTYAGGPPSVEYHDTSYAESSVDTKLGKPTAGVRLLEENPDGMLVRPGGRGVAATIYECIFGFCCIVDEQR